MKSLSSQINLIPDITDEQISEMLGHMAPVKLKPRPDDSSKGRYHILDIEDVNPRKTAYTWEPKYGRQIALHLNDFRSGEIITFHRFAYQGFFKPSLAEVLAQIRATMTDWRAVRYFFLQTGGESEQGSNPLHIMGQYHVCKCHMWGEGEYE